jgi:DNA-binding transcriptional MerR regulator
MIMQPEQAMERRASVEDTGLATTQEFSSELAPTAAAAKKQFEIQSAIVLAKRFPRDEDQAFQKLMKACNRSSFAEDAEYSFPRGGQAVKGPSVFLAREAARVWTNIRYGLTITRDDQNSRQIQAWAWDLETNTKISAEDDFRKLIFRKGKGWIEPDERDLRELTNRRGAILIRNCVLQILPKDLIEDALETCRTTLRSNAAKDPDATRKKILLAFSELNVTAEMLAAYLGHPVAQSSPAEMADLRAVYKSISDGNTTWSDYIAGNSEATAADLKAKTQAKSDELKEKLGTTTPVDEDTEKKRLRKLIRDLHPKDIIEKHTGGKKLDAMSVDELVTLRDALAES